MPDLLSRYHDVLKQNNWQADEFQTHAVQELQRLLIDLNPVKTLWPFVRKKQIKGVYLYGGVGRGKSMLMDLFFDEASIKINKLIKKRKVHFHQFMIETHDWLHQHRGEGMDDLLPRYADYVSNQAKLLCFDEFHVTDVADAMILGRLFTELFNRNVVIVATSNWAPHHLYEGGLQRDRFLPFIKLLQEKMAVLYLDSDKDYRTIANPDQDLYYFYPLSAQVKSRIEDLFKELSNGAPMTENMMEVKGRKMSIHHAGDVAYFTFAELCEQPLGAEDYIAIAGKYNTIFITNIPHLGGEKRNEAKRFILLIDCLYEAQAKVIISAETKIENLYWGDDHGFEFDRTISRLIEMQSLGYHQERLRG